MTSRWTPQGQTIRLGQRDSVKQPPNPKASRPRLIGDGPPEAATQHGIERQPFCWDCNGFYRRLGLPPGAPRIEVARAFLEVQGYRSSYLTNAARVLTNKVTKRLYDALPLGAWWPDDEALVEAIISSEMVEARGAEWAYYLLGDIDEDSVTPLWLSEWRTMIALLIYRSGMPVRFFSMGVAEDMSVAIVGYRLVVFVPLTSKPAWDYVRSIVLAIQDLLTG